MRNQDSLYMDITSRVAQQSYAVRLKVGAVVVKDNALFVGYNGTPSGMDNTCEEAYYDREGTLSLKTKSNVVHAEENCLGKMLKAGYSSKGATIYIEYSPCIYCAKLIYNAGITRVVYRELYHSADGIEFLKQCNIMVEQYVPNL